MLLAIQYAYSSSSTLGINLIDLDMPSSSYNGFRFRIKGTKDWTYMEKCMDGHTEVVTFTELKLHHRYTIEAEYKIHDRWESAGEATFVVQEATESNIAKRIGGGRS